MFSYTNESQSIFLPKEGTYDFIYKGTGEGPTTVTIEDFIADEVIPVASFVDLPTTDNTDAEFSVSSSSPETTIINLDIDGDGQVDKEITKGVYEFSGFLQPISQTSQDLSVFKAGSTIPVKFQLKKWDGTITQAEAEPVWLYPKRGSKMDESAEEYFYDVLGTTGNTYKWDPENQQYIFNWSTKKLKAGYWYEIYAKLDDGNTYSVTIGLR